MQADRNQLQENSVAEQPTPNDAINQLIDPSTDSSAATLAEVSDRPVPGGTINQPSIDQRNTSSTTAADIRSQATPSGSLVNQLVLDEPGIITPPQVPSNLEKHSENENKFKTELKNKNFFEAFASVAKDVVQLEILTLVEDEIDLNHHSLENIEGQPGRRMVTTVNLLSGDIKNIIGNRFIENNAYVQLREYHSEQVIKSHQIIKDNLDCLYTAIKHLTEIYKEDKIIKEEENQRP